MAFYKKCSCGKKTFFNRPMDYPDNCPECGRRLSDFLTMNEDDDPSPSNEDNSNNTDKEAMIETHSVSDSYLALITSEGVEIPIPDGECIIGRTEIGAEQLANYSSISRKHLKVKTRKRTGIIAEDISSYGTMIDGVRMNKNELKLINIGSKITLCNLETTLVAKEVGCNEIS